FAIVFTRAPVRPWAANSARAAARMDARDPVGSAPGEFDVAALRRAGRGFAVMAYGALSACRQVACTGATRRAWRVLQLNPRNIRLHETFRRARIRAVKIRPVAH